MLAVVNIETGHEDLPQRIAIRKYYVAIFVALNAYDLVRLPVDEGDTVATAPSLIGARGLEIREIV